MFTDNDLKLLKDISPMSQLDMLRNEDKLIPLLARLEAAEQVCLAMNRFHEFCECSVCDCLEDWRKAAGK